MSSRSEENVRLLRDQHCSEWSHAGRAGREARAARDQKLTAITAAMYRLQSVSRVATLQCSDRVSVQQSAESVPTGGVWCGLFGLFRVGDGERVCASLHPTNTTSTTAASHSTEQWTVTLRLCRCPPPVNADRVVGLMGPFVSKACALRHSYAARDTMRPLASCITRLSRLLTADTVAILERQGYLIIDQALPARTAQQLHDEILHCYDAGHMDSNCTAYVQSHSSSSLPSSGADEEKDKAGEPIITRLFSKPNIFEAELLPTLLDDPTVAIPTLSGLSSDLLPWLDSYLGELLPSLLLYTGHSSVKLQLNTGNGSFPFHYDSPGNRTDTRRLTVLLYLNSDWQPGHGGEMVLQGWLLSAVKVAPVMNRMLIFRSDRLLHRVEPSHTRRLCLTMWLHGRGCDPPLPELDDVKEGEEVGRVLEAVSHPAYQRSLSKVLYASVWRASYAHAHRGSGAVELIASLDEDVRRLMAGEQGVVRLVELLQEVVDEKAQHESVRGWSEGDIGGGDEQADKDELDTTTGNDQQVNQGESGNEEAMVGVPMREVSVEECGFLDFL